MCLYKSLASWWVGHCFPVVEVVGIIAPLAASLVLASQLQCNSLAWYVTASLSCRLYRCCCCCYYCCCRLRGGSIVCCPWRRGYELYWKWHSQQQIWSCLHLMQTCAEKHTVNDFTEQNVTSCCHPTGFLLEARATSTFIGRPTSCSKSDSKCRMLKGRMW